jgi:hypothetical protein
MELKPHNYITTGKIQGADGQRPSAQAIWPLAETVPTTTVGTTSAGKLCSGR